MKTQTDEKSDDADTKQAMPEEKFEIQSENASKTLSPKNTLRAIRRSRR